MKACSALLLTVLLLAHGSVAEAQFSAQLQGTVQDQTGGVMPGAAVTLANVETGVSLTTVSDANGGFRFPNLAPAPTKRVSSSPASRQQRSMSRF